MRVATTRVAAIVGPTAVGKSQVAVAVAERLGAEIVSVDSMQIYLDMDVGTDKPTLEMRARVPHHLLDLKRPSSDVTVAEFQALARAAIDNIASRGRLPLLVGGSGLYFRAVVDDLRFPPRSPDTRQQLEAEAERIGAEALHERLKARDPRAAQRIEPSNARRTIRALEVIEVTGQPFSANDAWERYESLYELAVAGLELPRDELARRIAARVERMLEAGLVDEARRLEDAGLGRTARQALGYRQILDAPGDPSPADIRDDIVRATRRFARRQESWFKADPRVTWFDAARSDLADSLVAYFSDALRLA